MQEENKARIVEVKRSDPSSLYRYTEEYFNSGSKEELTFVSFAPIEPDASVFQVPAICGSAARRQFHRF